MRIGGTGYERTAKELFGNVQTLTSSIYLPMRIECVDGWFPFSSGVSRSAIAAKHTLYPYWAISYTPDFRAETDRILNGGTPASVFDRVCAIRSRRSWSKHLKYCPLCAAGDISKYGETYWHRQHQLSEMLYCTKHQTRLIDSDVTVKRAASGFYPASSEAAMVCGPAAPDDLAPHKDKLLRIGQECEWLIKHGLAIDWAANGYEKYWHFLRDKRLASFQGRCDYPSLDAAFNEYWGKGFLDLLFDKTDNARFEGWTHRVDRNKMRHYRPLYHILLMCFLAGSVSGFVRSTAADTPYGHPPFVCKNPICPYYHIDGAEMVALRYYGNGATAVFECSHCGMRYRHNKAKHSKEIRVVEDYGHLWDNELRRCNSDPRITNEQTAGILKCSMSVLMLQNKKRGLLEPALYDTEMGPEKYYKPQVEELCKEYNEVTIALLQEKVPGAYSYLGDHHKEWLRSRIVFENERKHHREHEERLLEKVQGVIDQFVTEVYPKRQVTFGYVASRMGLTMDELRCRKSTRALLEDVVETEADWLRRRTAEICMERIALSKSTTVKTVRRELNLQSATFIQFESLIQEMVGLQDQ